MTSSHAKASRQGAQTSGETYISKEAERATFLKDGVIVLDLPSDVLQLQRSFLEEVCLWLDHWGGGHTTPEKLIEDLVTMASRNRELVGRLYTVCRRFVSAKRLASHPYLVNVAQRLMNTDLVSCCNFVSVRFDLPRESEFLSHVHQDFIYIQGSLNGITIWLPFSDISLNMGPPSFVPGSQQWGVLKVKPSFADGKEGEPYIVVDNDRLREAEFVKRGVSAAEALVFHTLLVHRSEPNTSKKARLSIQVRFDDLFDTTSFAKNYPEGLFLGDSPTKIFPEFVVRAPQN